MSLVRNGNVSFGDEPFSLEKYLEGRRLDAEDRKWAYLLRDSMGRDFAGLLRSLSAITPSKSEQKRILAYLQAAEEGKAFEVLTIVCPDYASETVGGERRYTFNGLCDGIGIVAERTLEVYVKIARFMSVRGLSVRLVIAMADHESDDEGNRRRVNLSRDEFVARMRRSQTALTSAATREGVTIETPFLSEIAPELWAPAHEHARELVNTTTRGHHTTVQHQKWKLYDRWEGRFLSHDEALERAKGDIESYIAIGKYLASENRLILGLDMPVMAQFLRLGAGSTPVIYFDRKAY